MLNKEVLYSLADISIIPCVTTDIISRKECYPYLPDLEGNQDSSLLPIIVSPMSCNWTKGISDARIYRENKINVVVPRTVDLNTRLHSMETIMTAFSLKEAEQILEDDEWTKDVERLNVCIDMANGHMTHQIELGKMLKEKFGERLKLMGGNIANPKTYLEYDKAGFDYIRIGIGGGSACFIEGTMITMASGEKKNISEVYLGDLVKTKSGNYQVTNLIQKEVEETLTINKKITCTKNHKFFVINKKDKELVNESNLDQFGYYVEAQDLNEDIHLLVKIE